MTHFQTHLAAIGTPGKPWNAAEKHAWRQLARKQRDYHNDVVSQLSQLPATLLIEQYGKLRYDTDYPLYVIKNAPWQNDKPTVIVTGGVHGYERSGVHGALQFALNYATDYLNQINVVIFPCISPWGYETINRWTPLALDPNRSFYRNTPVSECAAVLDYLDQIHGDILLHIDLHETTDTDDSEFRPALAARDGKTLPSSEIPDGFYLVADSERLELDFQTTIIDAVSEVTHIAPTDNDHQIIGCPILAPGVIAYPMRQLQLCGSITSARYHTTTEVYPDSSNVTNAQCNQAQVIAITSAITYALTSHKNHA